MSSPVAAQRIVASQGEFELIPRSRVVQVRDEQQARDLLARAHQRDAFGGDTAPDLDDVARAVACGELVLVRRELLTPLDPPDPDLVPLLSELGEPMLGGDPITHAPTEVPETWFEARLVDAHGRPLPDLDVTISSGGAQHSARSDADGVVRLDDVTGRQASLRIPGGDTMDAALSDAAEMPPVDPERLEAEPGVHVLRYRGPALGPVSLDPESPATVSVQPEAGVVSILQAEDIHFGNERVVFLPEPPRDPSLPPDEHATEGVTGLSLARAVLQYGYLNPSKQVAFVGHADALGSAGTNLTVSRDRAENVKLLVMGEREAWAQHCVGHYAVDDVQNLLIWAAHTWGYASLPGEVDNAMGEQTQGALDAFRREYNEQFDASIPEEGSLSQADWEAFFDLMDATLEAMLDASAPELTQLRDGTALLEDGIVACGEAWCHEPIVMQAYPESSLRRVDVLFFDESDVEKIDPESEPPLKAFYGSPEALARKLDADPVPFGLLEYEVWASLRSHWTDRPVGDVHYELVGPHPSAAVVREGVADDGGELRERSLLPGNYELLIGGDRIPVAARIMDHHPAQLGEPSHVRLPDHDAEERPVHLFSSAQPGEWVVPASEFAPGDEEPDPELEDGAD